MTHVITLRDLHPLDILVLRDLVRFGVLTNDQIERRYRDPAVTVARLALLQAGGLLNKPREEILQGAIIYSASRYGVHIARSGLGWRMTPDGHLAHDIA